MMRLIVRVLLVTLVLAWCQTGAARGRVLSPWVPRPASILIVTAHPDDEVLLAPFLAMKCVYGGVRCSFLVLTRGEEGGDPETRTGEMARAAALFHARLTQWSLPDVMTGWPDHDSIVRQVGDVIATEKPDMILTFDPAHGSTGHPAHRETGEIVLATGAQNVWMIETLARFEGHGFVLSPSTPPLWTIVAGDLWEFVVLDAEAHGSQFSPAQLESLRTLPEEQRRVWLRPAR